MTPEQIALINTLAFVLDKIGSWPIGTLFFAVIVGPWVFAFVLHSSQNKRFDAVKQMYENNVQLVKSYEQIAENLQDLVIMNTQAMKGVQETVEHNLFCPIVRKGTNQQEASP